MTSDYKSFSPPYGNGGNTGFRRCRTGRFQNKFYAV